jgi:hypothetical protein
MGSTQYVAGMEDTYGQVATTIHKDEIIDKHKIIDQYKKIKYKKTLHIS